MLIAIDFDGTIVRATTRAFSDVATPLQFLPGAREGLRSLKRAGHTLLLYSARTNRALLYTPEWDPLVRAGVRRVDKVRWKLERPIHWARYRQMLAFVEAELPGVFAVVDDGMQGKPNADLFIDDRALRFGTSQNDVGWSNLTSRYGAPPPLLQENTHGR